MQQPAGAHFLHGFLEGEGFCSDQQICVRSQGMPVEPIHIGGNFRREGIHAYLEPLGGKATAGKGTDKMVLLGNPQGKVEGT